MCCQQSKNYLSIYTNDTVDKKMYHLYNGRRREVVKMEIVDLIVKRLHETIENGKLGLDYTFDCGRKKNKSFDREYNVQISQKVKILLKLKREHYVKSEESKNEEHVNDTVHIFKIKEKLMPRYDELADYRLVCIYIKVTWPEGKEPMFIISFHEDEE